MGTMGIRPMDGCSSPQQLTFATILIITKDCLTVTHSLTQILKTPQNNLTRDHVGLPDQRHLGGASRTILGKEQPE